MALTPEEIASQQRAITLNRNIRSKTQPPPPTNPQEGLDQILQNPNVIWKYSDSGAGGALLAIPNGPGVTGAAIKTEHRVMVKKGEKVAQMINGFLQDSEGQPPFSAPRAKVYGPQDYAENPTVALGLLGHLKNVDTSPFKNSFKEDNIKSQKKTLQDTSQGLDSENSTMVMEFAKGKQANLLQESEKLALIKSEAFAQTIGRAFAPSIAVGLSDHLGSKVNVSNFMYDTDSGTLSVIDYDTEIHESPDRNNDEIKFGITDTAKRMEDLRTYLEDSLKDQQSFDAAINNLINPKGKKTPLTGVMNGFFKEGGDSFFQSSEKNAVKGISKEDKRQFALNLMKGAIEGLEYVQKNEHALQNGALATRETVNGKQLDHFYTDQELQDLHTELARLDGNQLKTKLDQLIPGNEVSFRQARSVEVPKLASKEFDTFLSGLDKNETDLNTRLAEVQRKIARIENNPTAGDRLKAAFTKKNHHPIDKLKAEERDIQKQLTMVGDLRQGAQTNKATAIQDALSDLKARQDFQHNMNTVESQVKPPTIQAPKQGQGTTKVKIPTQSEDTGHHSVRESMPGYQKQKAGGNSVKEGPKVQPVHHGI